MSKDTHGALTHEELEQLVEREMAAARNARCVQSRLVHLAMASGWRRRIAEARPPALPATVGRSPSTSPIVARLVA